MKHLMQEANSFFKNQLSMRSHTKSICRIWLSVYLVDNYIPIHLKKAIDLSIFSVRKCAWRGNAENGVGGKEMDFFLSNGIKLIKMHSDGKLILCLSIYTNNKILCIIWKFDLSSRGVLGRIYTLSIEVLYLLGN